MFNNSRKKFTTVAKKLKTVAIFSLVFLWSGYLISANYAAAQSFKLDSLSTELKNTEQEVLLLNVKSSELQSIERITDASKSLSLVQTKDVYYLLDTQEVVALK